MRIDEPKAKWNWHTAGKWETVADCQFGTESTKVMCGDSIVCVCYGSNHANDARLIAAGPEILEALRHIMRCIPMGGFAQIHHGSSTWEQIDAAVTKAIPLD